MMNSEYARCMRFLLEQEPPQNKEDDPEENDDDEKEDKWDLSADPNEPDVVTVKSPLTRQVAQAFDVEIDEAYPEVSTKSLAHGGGNASWGDRRYTEPADSKISQDEIDLIEKNQDQILKFAEKAFVQHPYATALTAIETWLQRKFDLEPGKAATVAGVVANMLGNDKDPQTFIFQKVAPMLRRYNVGSYR